MRGISKTNRIYAVHPLPARTVRACPVCRRLATVRKPEPRTRDHSHSVEEIAQAFKLSESTLRDIAEAIAPRLASLLRSPLPVQEWFNREQAAHYIGSTKEALRHMLREKILPVYVVKGRERIARADIDKMFLENKHYLK